MRILDEIGNKDIPNRFFHYRIKIAIELPLLTGMRIGEVCGLMWSDIDLDNGKLYVRHNKQYSSYYKKTLVLKPKTRNSVRTVTLTDRLIKDLREFLNIRNAHKEYLEEIWNEEQDFVLTDLEGNGISNGVPYHWFQTLIRNYKLKKISYHDLRHTHVSQLLMAGVNAKTVAARVGHKDASVTLKVYAHFLPESDKAAADKLNEIFSDNSESDVI